MILAPSTDNLLRKLPGKESNPNNIATLSLLINCAACECILRQSVFCNKERVTELIFLLCPVYAMSYLAFSSAGPAAPEKYVHGDGGTYRGQWEGLRKEGVGTYTYPSGAVYEGEWRDNQKSGRGIYTFPNVNAQLNLILLFS